MILPTATSRLGRRYGYQPPSWAILHAAPARIPALAPVDLRPGCSPIRNQGGLGTCYAFTVAALAEIHYGLSEVGWLSPAYIAWRTRLAEGTFPEDHGASLADAMGIVHAWGVCPEDLLPYTEDATQDGTAIHDAAAHRFRVLTPCLVDVEDLTKVRRVLAAGKAIALGFACHANFERVGADGVVPPRLPGDGLLGGHAVLCVGLDDQSRLILRNSWGGWGDRGYCYAGAELIASVFEAWTA